MHITGNRVDHYGSRGVVRPCLGSFQAHLQCRGEPCCYWAAVISAWCCSHAMSSTLSIQQPGTNAERVSVLPMQALVLGQSPHQGTHGREGQWIFLWISMKGDGCKTLSAVVWACNTQTNDSIFPQRTQHSEGSGIFGHRSRVHPGRSRDESADVQDMLSKQCVSLQPSLLVHRLILTEWVADAGRCGLSHTYQA